MAKEEKEGNVPGLQDTKKGSGDIDNHVLKMKPYEGGNRTRFIKKRNVLFDELGQGRKVSEFLDDRILGDSDFVLSVLSLANDRFERSYALKRLGYDLNRVAEKVAEIYEIYDNDTTID